MKYPKIAERITQPTPEEVRAARERAGLNQTEAGELVSTANEPRRSWDKYEKPVTDKDNHRAISLPVWELFLLLTEQHPSLGLKKLKK